MNTKLIFAVVAVIFFTNSAQSQTQIAGTKNVPAYQKIMKTGPEGETALYWWNPNGNNGLGHYQLASDSSESRMNSQQIISAGYKKINGEDKKITTVVINGQSVEFYFDGYWRKYPSKTRELSQ